MADAPHESSSSDKTNKRHSLQSSRSHTFATVIGLILIAASIGTLLFDALVREESPPEIVLHVEEVQSQPSGNFVVLFRAENRGNSTASGLSVTGEIQDVAGNRETSQVRLDYVPAQSERRGGLFFSRDPRQAELKLRATGYEEP